MNKNRFSSRDLIQATTSGGRCRFCFRDGVTLRVCLFCDAEFEQTDDGFALFKQHEFEHGAGTLFDWSELDGKALRLIVVPYETELRALYSSEADLYAVDDDAGVVYHLSHEYVSSWQEKAGGWKWKVGKPTTPADGQKPMLPDQALRLIGSKSTVEK